MIWLGNVQPGDGGHALASFAADTLQAYLSGGQLPDGVLQEVAKAVGGYLSEAGIAQEAFDEGLVVLLAAQALAACGEESTSCRLLVFGTGLAEPAVWEFTGGQRVWSLDLRQVTVRDNAWLELRFFPLLTRIVRGVSEVWNESSGEGTLGLRPVCQSARGLLGGSRSSGDRQLSAEVLRHCRAVLDQVGAESGWRSRPRVVNLDVS